MLTGVYIQARQSDIQARQSDIQARQSDTALLRKVVQQNRMRQCRRALWVIAVHGP